MIKVFPLVPSVWYNAISGLGVIVLLYSNIMRIITGSSNEMKVTARERAVAEEIMQDTRFVMQAEGHVGCHERSIVRAWDELA